MGRDDVGTAHPPGSLVSRKAAERAIFLFGKRDVLANELAWAAIAAKGHGVQHVVMYHWRSTSSGPYNFDIDDHALSRDVARIIADDRRKHITAVDAEIRSIGFEPPSEAEPSGNQ